MKRFVIAGSDRGKSGRVKMRAQLSLRPLRLVVPGNIGPFFAIKDFLVNGRSQLIGSSTIPALAFSEVAIDNSLALDVCPAGKDVIIKWERTTTLPLKARLALFLIHWRSETFRALRWLWPWYYPDPPFMVSVFCEEVES